MNKLIMVIVTVAAFAAQAEACTHGGMRGIFYRCCGREVFINVCTTGGTTPCQEFSYQINCGCSYIGSASATCLSSAAAEDKSGRVDTLLAEALTSAPQKASQCSPRLLEVWVHSKGLDHQQ
jgi:hypothetical protein